MPTLASATTLLHSLTNIQATQPLLSQIGITGNLVALDPDSILHLGLTPEFLTPHIAREGESLRALVFTLALDTDLRPAIARAASRLATRTPHLLWLIIAIAKNGEIVIATWNPGSPKPRIAALVTHHKRIVDSDAETVCALSASPSTTNTTTHQRWLEILGRQSISRNFFTSLQFAVSNIATDLTPKPGDADAAELALICTSRLIFLCFLETKGWLNRDHGFLANSFADCMLTGGRYHQRVLTPLFFGTLNTLPRNRAPRGISFGRIPFLNGGLFARSPLEHSLRHSHATDESLGHLYSSVLTKYRFTAREDTSSWTEAAVDPEMLGKSFECLMAPPARKTTGAFYTPQSLVDQLTAPGLAQALCSRDVTRDTVTLALKGEKPPEHQCAELLHAIAKLRVLDPACGSGAFLVHTLEQLSTLCTTLGDERPPHTIRRSLLSSSIFGVDINPMAVWLCELRLWLSMAIEDPERDPMRVKQLPNLDRHIRVGDSLAGDDFRGLQQLTGARHLEATRTRYSRSAGPRKRTLSKILDRAERACAIESLDTHIAQLATTRREILATIRSRDLFGQRPPPTPGLVAYLNNVRLTIRNSRRVSRALSRGAALPFSYQTQFADASSAGGFDLVIGNPPWVRTGNLEPQARTTLRQQFWVYKNSAWQHGARAASAPTGFASQVDLAALFAERSVQLTRPSGGIALILPAKLWQSLAGGGLRSYLLRHTDISTIHDLTQSHQIFDAAVYPSLIVASRQSTAETPTSPPRSDHIATLSHRRAQSRCWTSDASALAFDASPGSPWLLIPPEVRAAFNTLSSAGIPLSKSQIGRPMLGVKTGCNDAFIVEANPIPASRHDLTSISTRSYAGDIEEASLRPLIRGESVTAWRSPTLSSRIIWTHGENGTPLRHLPPYTRRWLGNWRHKLESRSDAAGKPRWWMLFRTESAESAAARVVWPDIGKTPRATVFLASDHVVPLNSCYAVHCKDATDAHTFAALLNSSVAAAWLNTIAEPARGGYHRYLAWTMALLPLPKDWERARHILGPIGQAAASTANPPSPKALTTATLNAYQLDYSDIEPLILWHAG